MQHTCLLKGFDCVNQNLTLYHRMMTFILSEDWILWANVENLTSNPSKKFMIFHVCEGRCLSVKKERRKKLCVHKHLKCLLKKYRTINFNFVLFLKNAFKDSLQDIFFFMEKDCVTAVVVGMN